VEAPGVEEDPFDAMFGEDFVKRFGGFLIEGRMTDLNSVGVGRWERLQVSVQCGKLGRGERWRKLEEDGPHARPKRVEGIEKEEGLFAGVLKTLEMCDRAGKLEAKSKGLRRVVGPALQGGRRRNTVERGVAFYGVEDRTVLLQEIARFGILRKELAHPFLLCPDGAAEMVAD
jgi:hypothetical protein